MSNETKGGAALDELERESGQHPTMDKAKASADSEDLTYGDIVWAQFRKNTVSYYSLWFLGFLFALAIFAPVISSDRPFIWGTAEGTSYPWVTSLFDRNFYPVFETSFYLWKLLFRLGSCRFKTSGSHWIFILPDGGLVALC